MNRESQLPKSRLFLCLRCGTRFLTTRTVPWHRIMTCNFCTKGDR